MNEHIRFADAILPHVLAAGAVIMRYFRAGVTVETKAGGSPVTAADRDAENILLSGLAEVAPGVPVIAEEMAEGQTLAATGSTFLLVDPLDGTREFTSGRSEFTVNIGLVQDGRPVLGVIYAPALMRLYVTLGADFAATGLLDPDAEVVAARLEAIAPRRLAVRRFAEGEPLVVSASRSHGSAEVEAWLERIVVAERVNVGSSLKFCQVASGDSHVYPRFGPTMEWDTAAGHALVLAAGGIVTGIDGSDLRYGKYETGYRNGFFIASAQPLPAFYHRADG